MRGKRAKALRRMAEGIAGDIGAPAVAYEVVKHQIKVRTPDGVRVIERQQLVLAPCVRSLYHALKRGHMEWRAR